MRRKRSAYYLDDSRRTLECLHPAARRRRDARHGGRQERGVVALRDDRPLPLRLRPARPRVAARRRAARPRRGARQAGPRRRVLRRLARDRLPRLPLVAARRPDPAASRDRRRRGDGDELYATARGVDWSEHLGAGRHAGRRLQRHQPAHPRHAVRRGARQGRHRRPAARAERRRAAVGRPARAGRARQRPPRRRARDDLARPERRRACTGAATAPTRCRSRRRSRRTWPPACCCTRPGPRWPPPGAACWTRSAGRARCPSRRPSWPADVAPGLLRAEDEVAGPGPPARRHRRSASCAGAATTLASGRRWSRRRASDARPVSPGWLRRVRARAIRGSDRDPRAVKVARDLRRARRPARPGHVRRRPTWPRPTPAAGHGLLAANAPYGERLDAGEAEAVYRQLGERLRGPFAGWDAVVLAGDQPAARRRRRDGQARRPRCATARSTACSRTSRPARLPQDGRAAQRPRGRPLRAPRPADAAATASEPAPTRGAGRDRSAGARGVVAPPLSAMLGGGAEQLANRLRKNLRRLGTHDCGARASPATGSTTPTCPSTTSSSTCTATGCTCRSTRAPPEIDPGKAKRRGSTRPSTVIGAVLEVPARARRRSSSAAASAARRSTSAAATSGACSP